MFADGALGPRTAAMIQPYDDDPENLGMIVTSKEEMAEKGLKASSHGISVAIHAIGDRANRDVLDVFAFLRSEEGKVQSLSGNEAITPLRHRIEHAQIVDPIDFRRFAELVVIASMQPVHAATDREAAERRWGDRSRFSYAWRTMLDNGVELAFGTDAPVEPIDPIRGIYAAVTRRNPQGGAFDDRWHPEQRLTLSEALRAYTFGPAYASGQELSFGSISPGKFADMTIYDRDIFSIPTDELLEVAVDGTIVGGEFKFRNR